MKLFKTEKGVFLKTDASIYKLEQQWDELVNRDNLYQHLSTIIATATPVADKNWQNGLLPPIASQEVWAAGVTYLQSRDARVEESQESGGAQICTNGCMRQSVPEIFFKSTPQRVVGHNQEVSIRKDSTWNVPEPELTLFINSKWQTYKAIPLVMI
jgi:2-dehydro-3-deoxy-D-arabinonate dehydratase